MAHETYVIVLDIGHDRNFRRDVLGARPDKDSAAAAIKTYVESENAELRQLWVGSTPKHLSMRLFELARNGLSAKNGFGDCHVWADVFCHDATLG